MSRIGKKSVPVPAGVTVDLAGLNVSVKGPKGELKFLLTDQVIAKMEEGGVKVDPKDKSKLARSAWGMSRTMIANMIKGVTTGYTKSLEITGVGYRGGPGQSPAAGARLQSRHQLCGAGRYRDQDAKAHRNRDLRHRQTKGRPGCR